MSDARAQSREAFSHFVAGRLESIETLDHGTPR